MSETTESVVTTFDQLLAAGQFAPDGSNDRDYNVGADWMQGRTAFGGLSSALALDTAMLNHPGDAPLRSAQVSFVGPVASQCSVSTRLLRESKSSRFVSADLSSEAGYGTNALFTFMKPRTSHVDHDLIVPPEIRAPDLLGCVPDHPARPAFTRKFEVRPVNGRGFGHGRDVGEITTWVRWVDEPACDAHMALLALADALPPAAMPLFHQFGPVSSSTWIQHFLTDHPQTDDGWWLLHCRTQHVKRGFSSQEMFIWNSDRQLVSVGGQGVALYV